MFILIVFDQLLGKNLVLKAKYLIVFLCE